MKTRVILTAFGILSLALILSCGEDTVTDTGPGYSRSSPDAVLLAFAQALEQGDIDIYAECLSADYKYEFVPEDCERAGVPEKMPFWERDQDIAAMDSLFEDPSASMTEADLPVVGRWADDGDRLIRCDPWIRIRFRHSGVEDTTWLIYQSWLDIRFVRDEADTNLWQIAGIEEELKDPALAGAEAAIPLSTFGKVKARFRHLEGCEVSPRSTPERLIRNFALAMERMDINAYAECLADEYLFTFLRQDAEDAGLPPGEPWWGKTEDVGATANMFGDPRVGEIECEFEIAGGPWPTKDGVTYRLDPSLKFPVVEEGATEGIIIWVNNSWLDVEIVPDPYDGDKWVFIGIEEAFKEVLTERPAPGRGEMAEYTTFGSLKAYYMVEDF